MKKYWQRNAGDKSSYAITFVVVHLQGSTVNFSFQDLEDLVSIINICNYNDYSGLNERVCRIEAMYRIGFIKYHELRS